MIAEYLVTAADVWGCAIALMVRVPLPTHGLAVGVANGAFDALCGGLMRRCSMRALARFNKTDLPLSARLCAGAVIWVEVLYKSAVRKLILIPQSNFNTTVKMAEPNRLGALAHWVFQRNNFYRIMRYLHPRPAGLKCCFLSRPRLFLPDQGRGHWLK